MSSAKTGHAAGDASTNVTYDMGHLPDDEARARFINAAIVHAKDQLQVLNAQADAVQSKAEDVIDAWQQKVDEAQDIADEAAAELARWEQTLREWKP